MQLVRIAYLVSLGEKNYEKNYFASTVFKQVKLKYKGKK